MKSKVFWIIASYDERYFVYIYNSLFADKVGNLGVKNFATRKIVRIAMSGIR